MDILSGQFIMILHPEHEVLATIRTLASSGRFVAQVHCQRRMQLRGVRHHDLRHGLANATSIRRSDIDARSEWTVKGPDGSSETFVAALLVDAAPPGWIEVVTVHDDDGQTKGWYTP